MRRVRVAAAQVAPVFMDRAAIGLGRNSWPFPAVDWEGFAAP